MMNDVAQCLKARIHPTSQLPDTHQPTYGIWIMRISRLLIYDPFAGSVWTKYELPGHQMRDDHFNIGFVGQPTNERTNHPVLFPPKHFRACLPAHPPNSISLCGHGGVVGVDGILVLSPYNSEIMLSNGI